MSPISEEFIVYLHVPVICIKIRHQQEWLRRLYSPTRWRLKTLYTNNNLIKVACSGVPVVLCDRFVKDYNFNVVTVEAEEPMYELVQHLKDQGYTRPVLFTQNWENNSSRERRKQAFIAAVQKLYGYNPENDIYLISRKAGITASMKLEILINSLKEGDIPAIIGTNTMTTVRAYKAIKTSGLKIPEEIGVCGPEDWDWQSEMNWPLIVNPSITTFYVPTSELGEKSAKLLLELIEEKAETSQKIMLPCELRVRASTQRKSGV